MSRGPGRWQRALLAALAEREVVVVAHLVEAVAGEHVTRGQQVAARRAARSLVLTERARGIYLMLPVAGGTRPTHQLALTRPGSTVRGTIVPRSEPGWMRQRRTAEEAAAPGAEQGSGA